MTDLANKIASACLEAIQSRPDTPEVEELAEVVEPLLPNRAESEYGMIATLRTQNNRLRFEKKELREEISRLHDAGFPFAGLPVNCDAHDARAPFPQCPNSTCNGVLRMKTMDGFRACDMCCKTFDASMITEGSDV